MKLRIPLIVVVVCLSQTAFGAGLFLSERGVRPLARGGAFVAGADDLHSISYNPAGLSEAGAQLLIDASYLNVDTSFLRKNYFPNTSSGAPQTVTNTTPVRGYAPFLPLPTIAGSSNFGLATWNFAIGLEVPYAGLMEYSETITDKDTGMQTAAPQRYSSISSKGTALGILGLYASKTFFDNKLAIGFGPKVLLGVYNTTVALSSCPGVVCAEQDPDYDAINKVSAAFIFAPSLALGVRYSFKPKWRVGLSAQLPFWVDAPANIQVRLPNAALFNAATVDGHDARMQFALPLVLRLGFEWRPLEHLRVEFAANFEGWSIHNRINILRSGKGVNLLGVNGFPSPYPVGDLAVARNFRDTFNLKLGGEYFGGTKALGYRIRAGFSYDRSAIPTDYLNVLTVDVDKFAASAGFSLVIGKFSLDLVYSHIFGLNTTVDPTSAKIFALSPVRGNPVTRTAVNGGDYTLQASVFGLGISYRFY